MPGLGRDWGKIVKALSKASEFYRALNAAISFGRDRGLRKEAVKGVLKEPKVVLDLGAGDGAMSEVVLSEYPGIELTVMLDFLPEMLERARMNGRAERIVGLFEQLPFRNECCDAVVAAFSLRDSIDLERALGEVWRVLRNRGMLLVLDLAKPDSPIKRTMIKLYWMIIAPLAAVIRLGRKGAVAFLIHLTYTLHPTTSKLVEIYRRFFGDVWVEERFMGGIMILRASKRAGIGAS